MIRNCRINRRGKRSELKKRWLKQHQLGVSECNLRTCILKSSEDKETNIQISDIKIVTLNARSVKNKDHYIIDCIKNFGWDLAGIMETWLTENDQIHIDASELCKYRYRILTKKKQDRQKRRRNGTHF